MFNVDIDSIHTASDKSMCSPIKVMFSVYLTYVLCLHPDLKWFEESNPDPQTTRGKNLKQGDILDFFLSTLLHLPPLRFHCVRGCWDRTQQDCCDFGIMKG